MDHIYGAADRKVTLGITDMGAAGALAALGSAFNVQSNRQTKTGYEKVGQENGRMVTQEWNSDTRQGKYSVIAGNRFMVEAEGQDVEPAALRQAVEAIGYARLEALAH